jgi:hypothetical protein
MTPMTVWIVIKDDKVDEVFDNKQSALEHADNLKRKWSITKILEREVKSL